MYYNCRIRKFIKEKAINIKKNSTLSKQQNYSMWKHYSYFTLKDFPKKFLDPEFLSQALFFLSVCRRVSTN